MRSAQAILRLALAYPLAVGVCVNGLAVGFAIRLPLEAMEGRPPPEGAAPVVVIALGTVCAIAAACGFGALAYLLFTVFFEREVLVLGNAVIPEAVRVECNVRVESRWNWPARLLMRWLHARVLKAEAIFTVEDGQWTARNNLVVPYGWRGEEITRKMVRVWYRPGRPRRNWIAAVAQDEGEAERPLSFPLEETV